MKTSAYYLIISLMLYGCATHVPPLISTPPANEIAIAEVQARPEQYVGSVVRWGGVITKVENKPAQTWLEVVSRELKKNGQPRDDGLSSGRFIASFNGFIDPIVYAAGSRITVFGSIQGQATQAIGDYNYPFPIIAVTTSHLWPVESQPLPYDYPPPWWYYDPWPYYYPHPHHRW